MFLPALSNEDFDKAWEVHRSLIVDYTGMCCQWMLAIKIIITNYREISNSKNKSADTSKSEETPLQGIICFFFITYIFKIL